MCIINSRVPRPYEKCVEDDVDRIGRRLARPTASAFDTDHRVDRRLEKSVAQSRDHVIADPDRRVRLAISADEPLGLRRLCRSCPSSETYTKCIFITQMHFVGDVNEAFDRVLRIDRRALGRAQDLRGTLLTWENETFMGCFLARLATRLGKSQGGFVQNCQVNASSRIQMSSSSAHSPDKPLNCNALASIHAVKPRPDGS